MSLTAVRPATSPCVILNLHGVGQVLRELEPGEDQVWLSRDGLASALDAVQSRSDVRLTFDDGNLSDATIALPALFARGLTATFFLPASRVGRPGFLDSNGVRELLGAGMRIGSHGMDHRSWVGLSDEALHEEVAASRERLEQMIGRRVQDAACPFGAYDRRTLRALRDAGYLRVYTSDRGLARADAWLQPRNTLHRERHENEIRELLDHPPGVLTSFVRSARTAVKRWR